ncbi:MAG: hypothetical protein IJN83_05570, partial [Clostridia bacterium]|nr:hypothetical protein [Clostridia bacterium]
MKHPAQWTILYIIGFFRKNPCIMDKDGLLYVRCASAACVQSAQTITSVMPLREVAGYAIRVISAGCPRYGQRAKVPGRSILEMKRSAACTARILKGGKQHGKSEDSYQAEG